ncbi:MAG: hypothetical protein AB1632_10985 [Nitrospirota bacterium]
MDSGLKELIDSASKRGSKYLKGEARPEELPEKMAELGVLLLEKAKILQDLRGEKLKLELIEIQNKVDDLRKFIFSCKIQAK